MTIIKTQNVVDSFNHVYLNSNEDLSEKPVRENVPFFNFYPAQKRWKDYIGGEKM